MKISVSGVRGIFGQDLTLQHVLDFSRSFSQLITAGKCVLARDTRESGRIMSETASAALMAQGIDVHNLGIAPTPVACREARRHGAALIITASHNPLEWNGLKFILEGRAISEEELAVLQQARTVETKTVAKEFDLTSNYGQELRALLGDIDGRPKVAVDPGGGAASNYASRIFGSMGCQVASVNDTHGQHSRLPDPTADELLGLRSLVKSSGCGIGLALDMDGDRLVAVDGSGKKLEPDTTLLLCLSRAVSMGARKMVTSVDTSGAVIEFANSRNCSVVYSKVGEANVVSAMLKNGAAAGGEGSSAGFILSDFNLCRDGILAGALIAGMVGSKEYEECMQVASKYHILRGKVSADSSLHAAILDGIVQELEKDCSSVDRLDGVKGIFDEGSWILVRGSNTEHSMRISVESSEAEKTARIYNYYAQRIGELHERARRA